MRKSFSQLFDDYLIVDWSANNQPKTGKDSIWWCYLKSNNDDGYQESIENPSTRVYAFNQIKEILKTYPGSDRRLLVGFDFAYAYPQGFAQHFSNDDIHGWKAIWKYLHENISDDEHNRNNRFAVASEINQMFFNTAAPFWACPKSSATEFLSPKKDKMKQAGLFPEFRMAEEGNTTKSVWMLNNPGAVGGQTLMGLPYLYRLVTDPVLSKVTKVWPFETGLYKLSDTALKECQVILSEIYPSSINVKPHEGEVKDRAQVRQLASHLAGLDRSGKLAELFAGADSITPEQQKIIEEEEGWILGI